MTTDQAAGTLRRRQAPAARGRRLLPVVTLVWAATLAGAAMALVSLTDGGTAPQPPAPPGAERAGGLRLAGDRLPLSFGSASVGGVVRVTGPSSVMGLPVGPREQVLQAQVTVVNLRRQAVVFPPGHLQLRSRGGLGAVVTATGSSEGGRIEARSPHRFAIRFALAANAPLPRLAVRDPGTDRVAVVDLGTRTGLGTLDLAEHHQPATGGHRR